ncbi:MAG: rod shape-determining protein MreC [Vicinamibacterales bacterium]
MSLADLQQRPGILLGAALALHIALISLQVTTQAGVTVFQAVVFGGIAEGQRAASGAVGGVRGLWEGYLALRQVRTENEALRAEIGALQIALQQQRVAAERAESLRQLLEFRARTPLATTGAEVIGTGASPEFRTVTIDKGTSDGLAANLAVIAPAGVVGRITLPSPRASLVQLLVDRNAAAGALVERSRVQGIVVGVGDGSLRMDFVAATGDIQAGDRVVTSGIDGLFPKGFVIGTVTKVEHGDGLYHLVEVEPAVDVSRLEEVLVVLAPPPVEDQR